MCGSNDGYGQFCVEYVVDDSVDAQIFLATVEVSKAHGDFVDASSARATIGTLGAIWLASRHPPVMKPSSFRSLGSTWRTHVEPRWARRQVGKIGHTEVQTWVSELSQRTSATTALRAQGILSGILDTAIRDKRLTSNPARGLVLPKKRSKRKLYLSHIQVELLAEQSRYLLLVRFLAYTGLQWGEATGLRIYHADLIRQRVHVEDNAVMVNGKIILGSPKDDEERVVPVPDFLLSELATVARMRAPDRFVFGSGEEPQPLPNSQNGWFANAVKRARRIYKDFPVVTPHSLRHTAASLAVSAGANVKAVQRMLGHASAAMTLDVYADLFEDDLDAVATALSTTCYVSGHR